MRVPLADARPEAGQDQRSREVPRADGRLEEAEGGRPAVEDVDREEEGERVGRADAEDRGDDEQRVEQQAAVPPYEVETLTDLAHHGRGALLTPPPSAAGDSA